MALQLLIFCTLAIPVQPKFDMVENSMWCYLNSKGLEEGAVVK